MVFLSKNKTIVILIGIVLLALILRGVQMPDTLFFGPEQGRDMLVIRDIVVNHKLTLIGSKTDIPGVMHGPIFYYLSVIPFVASGGNPVVILNFYILIQALSVFLLYQFVFELTKKRSTGFIAALLFATGYLYVMYARWLSNPPLSIPLSIMFGISFLRFLHGKQWYLIAAAVLFGLLGQAEFINYLIYGVIILMLIFYYRKNFRSCRPSMLAMAAGTGLIVSVGTYVLFDLRHDFLITKSLVKLVGGETGIRVDFWNSVAGAFSMLWQQTGLMAGIPVKAVGGFLYGLGTWIVARRIRKDNSFTFVVLFLVIPPFIFSILRHPPLEQLYAGTIVFVLTAIAILCEVLYKRSRALAIAAIFLCVGCNIFALYRYLPKSEYVFYRGQQPFTRYTDQLKVIDWVYAQAGGRRFSFQAYTIPYFWQDAWTYLLLYYGNKTYGYVPDDQGRKLMYVVIQRDGLDPLYQKDWYEKTVVGWGIKQNGTTIGEYTIEELIIRP